MKNSLLTILLVITFQIALTSCEKLPGAVLVIEPTPVVTDTVPKDPNSDPGKMPDTVPTDDIDKLPTMPEGPAKPYNNIINVGSGSGVLKIDGANMKLKCNDIILIKGGKYVGIEIKNIRSADGCPITVKNSGLVEVSGDFNQMSLSDLKNIVISGDGTPGIEKGFAFKDNKYRAVQMSGMIDNFTLQHFSFRNIKDASISFQYKKVYDGTENSYSKNLKFLHISSENTSGLLSFAGGIEDGVISGLIKNIEIAQVVFQNSADAGAVVYMGNVDGFDIHHNRVNNVNTTNNNHNGIFSLAGNGKFYNNFISNHQGNAIRAWGHSIGNAAKNILIYNNIVINSRKYSGFEVQAFSNRMIPGRTTYINAVVFNNTCGNLNLSNDWQGNVVDVYSLKGGKCEVFNNLAYNFQPKSGIAGQQAELAPILSNNLYFKTRTEAGIADEISFKLLALSAAKGKGKNTTLTSTDYHGMRRSSKPSVGAVE